MTSILDKKNASAVRIPSRGFITRARRQKVFPAIDVPPICILDLDGDIVRRLRQTGEGAGIRGGYVITTGLDTFIAGGQTVGSSTVSSARHSPCWLRKGCSHQRSRLLLSVTSAGPSRGAPPPYFVIIDRALRDEG